MPLATTAVTGNTSPDYKTGIAYSIGILEGDFSETAGPSANGYSALCTVAWGDAGVWLEEMLGRTDILLGGILQRTLPEYCPHRPTAYAVQADLVRMIRGEVNTNDDKGWPEFEQAVYRVTYAIPLYDVLEDRVTAYEHQRFCVWRKRTVATNEKIPGGGFKFIDDAVAANRIRLNEVGVKTGRTLEMTCKWIDVPTFDYAILSPLSNRINEESIVLDGVEYPAETVLFIGADEEPRVNASGQHNRDINLTFAIRTDGRTWNKFWKNGTQGYVEVSDDGTSGGARPYAVADLNNIWTFS